MDPLSAILIVAAVALVLVPSPFSILTQRRLKTEIKKLHEQLHVKMEVDAKGIELLKLENQNINKMNDNLKATLHALRNKPDRKNLCLLHIYNEGIKRMSLRAPGFLQSWEMLMVEIENEMCAIEEGKQPLTLNSKPSVSTTKGANLMKKLQVWKR